MQQTWHQRSMWKCLTGRESPWDLTWQSDPNANANVMNASHQVPLCQEDVKNYVEQSSILSHLKSLSIILILPAEIQNLSSSTLSKSYLRWNRRRQLRKADHDIDQKWNIIGTIMEERLHMEAANDTSDYSSLWLDSHLLQSNCVSWGCCWRKMLDPTEFPTTLCRKSIYCWKFDAFFQ